jgi:hypothetical protein
MLRQLGLEPSNSQVRAGSRELLTGGYHLTFLLLPAGWMDS